LRKAYPEGVATLHTHLMSNILHNTSALCSEIYTPTATPKDEGAFGIAYRITMIYPCADVIDSSLQV